MAVYGTIHSVETMGTLDGPGLRYVIFMQGCSMRCRYCHNPDSWDFNGGTRMSVEELVDDILTYRSFIKSGGGVTISGGEPLAQAPFVLALVRALKEEGIHTAIDTAGNVPLELSGAVLREADLILLDIKSLDERQAFSLTGMGNSDTLATLAYCQAIGKDVWIRHVLVPGWTLDETRLSELSHFLTAFSVVKTVELLPYHNLGAYKWEQLKMRYPLKDVKSPTGAELMRSRAIFEEQGHTVLMTTVGETKQTKVS